jgi:hypothetical protein
MERLLEVAHCRLNMSKHLEINGGELAVAFSESVTQTIMAKSQPFLELAVFNGFLEYGRLIVEAFGVGSFHILIVAPLAPLGKQS